MGASIHAKCFLKQLIEVVLSQGFDIAYRRTWLADAYVDYDKGIIVIGDNNEISLLHECIHEVYDEILEESLSEENVEKNARKIIILSHPHHQCHYRRHK